MKKITFESPESRVERIGHLAADDEVQRAIADWIQEDHRKLLELADQYRTRPGDWYSLALALARRWHPAPSKRGPKLKWGPVTSSLLVVEVNLRKARNRRRSVEAICNQLATVEPWCAFINTKSKSRQGAPLRQVYAEFENSKWVKVVEDARSWLLHEARLQGHDGEDRWCTFVRDSVTRGD